MQEEFTITIEQVDFHFKRMEHPELPLTYHVHFTDWHQHTVFRMRRNGQGHWVIVPMALPHYVRAAEADLRAAIEHNEGNHS
ncbi:hypothetical protein EPD60_12955 [Flaviaesturariibacter flavus]|uniref:Uncharacterized protein n=1 Tax=Flaviaesturariibacter flavus TaxID=2502780 RepID=A0A4R1B8U0_9BACT|nr:hypothetical protein [Flaviaesturariibacter flavus]TCJ13295.1 hypothetical protein EPD60_12955 [Flaviaesturariibacter flavus]